MNPASLLQSTEVFQVAALTAQEAAGLKVGKATHENVLHFTCTPAIIPKSIPVHVGFFNVDKHIYIHVYENINAEGIVICITKPSAERTTFTL